MCEVPGGCQTKHFFFRVQRATRRPKEAPSRARGMRAMRQAKEYDLSGVAVPQGAWGGVFDNGRYELTVGEHKFVLVTVGGGINGGSSGLVEEAGRGESKNGGGAGDAKVPPSTHHGEGTATHSAALREYLDDGGYVFRPIRVYTAASSRVHRSAAARGAKLAPCPADSLIARLADEVANSTRTAAVRLLASVISGKATLRGLLASVGLVRAPIPLQFNADANVDPAVPAAARAAGVRSFAWHPTRPRWAVAVPGGAASELDGVVFRDLYAGQTEKLRLTHEYMRNANCMAWCPVGGVQIAVGCDHGVALWSLVRSGGASRQSQSDEPRRSAWLQHLPWPNRRLRRVEWSPCGRYIAACAFDDPSFIIWDVARGHRGGTPFPSGARGAAVTDLSWSPDGLALYVSSPRGFRIYSTLTWRLLCSQVASGSRVWFGQACWAAGGSALLVAHIGEPRISVFRFSPQQPLTISATIDLSPQPAVGNASWRPGGQVYRMALSPTSERLAVSFRAGTSSAEPDSKHGDSTAPAASPTCPLIGTFGVSWQGANPSFEALGFIRGPPSKDHPNLRNMPLDMAFRPNCTRGALLAVSWAEGQVTTYPFYFESTRQPKIVW